MMNLTNMRIGKRLGVGFGIALLLAASIAATAWWGLTAVGNAQDEAVSFTAKALRSATIANNVNSIYLAIWHIVSTKDQASKLEYKAALEELRKSYTATM